MPVERIRAWLTAALMIRVERMKACLMAAPKMLAKQMTEIPRLEQIPIFRYTGHMNGHEDRSPPDSDAQDGHHTTHGS
jgi:hypothetical protein